MFASLHIPFWKEVGIFIVGLLAVYLSPVGQSSIYFAAVGMLAVGLSAVFISVFGRYAVFMPAFGLYAVGQSTIGLPNIGLLTVGLSAVYLSVVGLLVIYMLWVLNISKTIATKKEHNEQPPKKENDNIEEAQKKEMVIVYDRDTGKAKELAETLWKEAIDLGFDATVNPILAYTVEKLVSKIEQSILVVMFMKTKTGRLIGRSEDSVKQFCACKWLMTLTPDDIDCTFIKGLKIAVFNHGDIRFVKDPDCISSTIRDEFANSITRIGDGDATNSLIEGFLQWKIAFWEKELNIIEVMFDVFDFHNVNTVVCIDCVEQQTIDNVQNICRGDHIIFHRQLYDHHAIVIDTYVTDETKDTKKEDFILAHSTFTKRSWFSFVRGKPNLTITTEQIDLDSLKISKCLYKRQYDHHHFAKLLSTPVMQPFQHDLFQRLSPTLIVIMANKLVYSNLSAYSYHLTKNNCEHFATFCASGAFVSFQASKLKVILQILFPTDKGVWYLIKSPLILISKLTFEGVSAFKEMENERLHNAGLMCKNCYKHRRKLLNVE